jgi:TolA-binding protein
MKKVVPIFFGCLLLLGPSLKGQDTKENADFKLAVNLYNDKLYDLALEQFRQFVATYPNTQQGIEARFYLGLSQSKIQRHDEARLTFQNFALAFPDHPKAPEAWWNVAESYVALRNYREAALAYERVKTFHPRSRIAPDALLKAAEMFDRAGEPENSTKVLRTLVQEYGSSSVVTPARIRLAELYIIQRQFELARVEAKRVVDISKDPPQKAQALVVMARALAALGRYDEAQSRLDEVIKAYPTTPSYYDALLLVGALRRETGSFVDAREAWLRIASDSVRAPRNARERALLELGEMSLTAGEAREALAYFERALALQSEPDDVLLLRAAVAAERAKDPSKAQQYARQILRDSSNRTIEYAALSVALRTAIDLKNASETIRIATILRHRFGEAAETRRLFIAAAEFLLRERKELHQAIQLLEDVLADDPNGEYADDAAYYICEALFLSGSTDKALEHYRSFINRYNGSPFVEKAEIAVERIEVFHARNMEAGLENLALLIGDVIAQQSKAELAYRLAEIYFRDLKDYEKAARQFASALELGIEPSKRPTALYYQAKSLEYVSLRQQSLNEVQAREATRHALDLYGKMLVDYLEGELGQQAALAYVKLRLSEATSSSEVSAIEADAVRQLSNFRNFAVLLFEVARRFDELNAYEESARVYRTILRGQNAARVMVEVQFRLGEALANSGQVDSALVVLRAAIKNEPRHHLVASALWKEAKLLAARGRVKDAIASFTQLRNRYPYVHSRDELLLDEARSLMAAGDYQSALDLFREYLRGKEEFTSQLDIEPAVWFDLAVCQERLGLREDAKRSYTSYLQRDAKSEQASRAFYALAGLARAEKNVLLATKYLQQASKLRPAAKDEFDIAAFEAAELFFKKEDYANALTPYNEALRNAKEDSLRQYIQSRIVVVYFRMNNATEADARAAAFLRQYPGLSRYAAEFEYERGMFSLRRGELENAKRHFDNVVQRYSNAPIVPQAMYGQARVAELAGRTEDAQKLYESLIQRFSQDPASYRAQLALGNLYYNQEKWDKAARAFKAILDDESRAPELVQFAMNNLILAYKELSLFDGALELTRKYIERFPDDPELINKRIDIGVLYQRLGYYDQSVVHLQSLLENADADTEAEVRYYIGEAYFSKGDYQQAILEFLKVPYLVTRKTKMDWTATSYYMAGQSYEKMARYDQALTMYQQIINRPGIDAAFKAAAQKEIDRVNALVKTK